LARMNDSDLDAVLDLLRPGMRVYVPGGCAEPTPLIAALRQRPEAASGITFVGIWIPGINQIDFCSLHPTAKMETIFLPPELHASHQAGRVLFRPMGYRNAWTWLLERSDIDLAFLTLSPGGSAGLCADFTQAAARAARTTVGLMNSSMPDIAASPRIDPDSLTHQLGLDFAPITFDGGGDDPVIAAIAGHVASLVRDYDALQFGIGRIPGAILSRLSDRRGLRIQSGMVVDEVLDLIEAGAIMNDRGAIASGLAMGMPKLYAHAAEDARFSFHGVDHTHDPRVLAATKNLVAINSALEVDLSGQINAEALGSRQISGAGGISDFLRGAALSPGGRPIVALAATAKAGTISRIVPLLAPGTPVTISRNDAGIVVTEYGIADLRGKSLAARADALIAIAAPQHQANLEASRSQAPR